jgi:hypothetical protein
VSGEIVLLIDRRDDAIVRLMIETGARAGESGVETVWVTPGGRRLKVAEVRD